VAWGTAEGREIDRACQALRLRRLEVSEREDPFAAVIRCTADPAKADKRTRSKWSRLMRYVAAHKPVFEPLEQFTRRKEGIQRVRRLPRPPRSRSLPWANETVTREQANHNGAMALCCSASSESGKPPCGSSCCCCYPGRSVVVLGLAVAPPQPAPADTQLRRCEGAIRSPHRSGN
jgi:hypothetical protein